MDGKDPQDAKDAKAPKHNSGWKVVVDFDLCESNAICMGIDPTIFEVRDDDFLYVLDEEPDDSHRSNVEEAVRRCPKQAISIADAKPAEPADTTKG